MGGERAAGVERAVDRVDHDPGRRRPSPKATSPRSSETATKEAPSAASSSSSAKTASSQRRSIDQACGRRPRRRPRRRCAPRSRALRRRSARWAATSGGRFPASLRRKRPSAGCYVALALGDGLAPPPTAASAIASWEDGPAAAARARRNAARPRCWRGRFAGSPPTGTGPERVAGPRLHAGRPRSGCAAGRGAARRAPTRSSGSGPGTTIAERLLREHAEAAGLDPFFDVARPRPSGWRCCSTASTSCRCASHEIRGNPAGLLARLLERIDDGLEGRRAEPTRTARAGPSSARPTTGSSPRPAASTAATSSSILNWLLERAPRRPRARSRPASPHLMVDELEETTAGPAGDPRAAGARRTRTRSSRLRGEERTAERQLVRQASHPDGAADRGA